MSDSDAALRARAEEIVRVVRDPQQWGMGREYAMTDVFEVWAWADAHRETAIMAALARVVAYKLLSRTGADPYWKRRFEALAAQAEADGDWLRHADWLEGVLVLAPYQAYPEQRRLLEALCAAYARLGDTHRRCWHLNRLAGVYSSLDEMHLAREVALESYQRSRAIEDELGAGLAAMALANLLEEEGRVRDAGQLLYAAWQALRDKSLFAITARDTLRTLQHDHGLSDSDVTTGDSLDALVAAEAGGRQA